MGRRKRKSNRSRKRKIPVLGIGVAAAIMDKAGFADASFEFQAGNYHAALAQLGDKVDGSNWTRAAALGVTYGLVKQALGPVPIISGKKFALTLF